MHITMTTSQYCARMCKHFLKAPVNYTCMLETILLRHIGGMRSFRILISSAVDVT